MNQDKFKSNKLHCIKLYRFTANPTRVRFNDLVILQATPFNLEPRCIWHLLIIWNFGASEPSGTAETLWSFWNLVGLLEPTSWNLEPPGITWTLWNLWNLPEPATWCNFGTSWNPWALDGTAGAVGTAGTSAPGPLELLEPAGTLRVGVGRQAG